MPIMRKSRNSRDGRAYAPQGKTNVGRLRGEHGSRLPRLSPEIPPLREVDAEASSEKAVQYWTQHGWKHGILIGAVAEIRPHGKKRTVKVPMSDVRSEERLALSVKEGK